MRAFAISVMGILLHSIAAAQSTQPTPEFWLSPVRVTQLKPVTFVGIATQTTFSEMGTLIGPQLEKVKAVIQQAGVFPAGGHMLVYTGMTGDTTKPFTLEVGVPLPLSSKPIPGLQSRELTSGHVATALYHGPMATIGQAYKRFFAQLGEAGHLPADETRLRYLYWEGPDSANNVLLIEVVLRE